MKCVCLAETFCNFFTTKFCQIKTYIYILGKFPKKNSTLSHPPAYFTVFSNVHNLTRFLVCMISELHQTSREYANIRPGIDSILNWNLFSETYFHPYLFTLVSLNSSTNPSLMELTSPIMTISLWQRTPSFAKMALFGRPIIIIR